MCYRKQIFNYCIEFLNERCFKLSHLLSIFLTIINERSKKYLVRFSHEFWESFFKAWVMLINIRWLKVNINRSGKIELWADIFLPSASFFPQNWKPISSLGDNIRFTQDEFCCLNVEMHSDDNKSTSNVLLFKSFRASFLNLVL